MRQAADASVAEQLTIAPACAGVIAATTAAERSGFDTFHVVNPHYTDGVSLDRIVDWVESAGYPVSPPLLPPMQGTLGEQKQ